LNSLPFYDPQLGLPDAAADGFVFLAEDDVDDRDFLVEALDKLDKSVKVIAINNGRKAIDFLKMLPPDVNPSLMILDFNLPEINGSEVLESIYTEERFRQVRKIVWSTSKSPYYEKLCMRFGADEYVVKPSDLASMERLAARMLTFCRR